MPKKEVKTKDIENTLAGIEKTFGKGSIMLMKDESKTMKKVSFQLDPLY